MLFGDAVLCDGNGGGRRADAKAGLFDKFERGSRDVFKFGRDGLDLAAERGEAGFVIIFGFDLFAGDLSGRAGLAGFKHDDVIAHRRGGLGEHAAELAAAHQAERFARHQNFIDSHRNAALRPRSWDGGEASFSLRS